MIIAIDGPAGSGKSTVSRNVAKMMKFFHLDTGAMYRCVTLKVMRKGIHFDDTDAVTRIAESVKIDFESFKEGQRVILDGVDVTDEIRLPDVTNNVKYVAKIPDVRRILVAMQREISFRKDVVLEGRDTTTVVFPTAELKIYLDASPEERAKRRFVELKEKGISVTYDEVYNELVKRDESDFNREVGPLKKAKGAYIIDTTGLTINEVVGLIVKEAKKRFYKKGFFYQVSRFISEMIFRIFFRLKAYGLENIPHSGGFILASNHVSNFDPVLAGVLIKRELDFIAKEELFKNRFFGWYLKKLNAHPIKRGDADISTIKLAEKLLLSGRGIVIFPEGTRSLDGRIQEPRNGIGFIVARTSAPVIPVYIKGAFDAFPKGAKFPKIVPLSVRYGKPLYFDHIGKGKEAYSLISDKVIEEIKRLENESYSS